MSATVLANRVELTASGPAGSDDILTAEALDFLTDLHLAFVGRWEEERLRRREQAVRFAAGERPDFLPETRAIRENGSWRVASPAPGLIDRRVEIAGPPTPKMAVDALGSGAAVWVADLEDATSPTWENVIGGQVTLREAVAGEIDLTEPAAGRRPIAGEPTTIVVRPRGWHLREAGLSYCGQPALGALVDFGLYFFHNAWPLLEKGTGPYFYLPKLRSHTEARLWNDIFCFAQDRLGIPRGTIRATVPIETVPAAFEMEEILYELREHSSGLDAGRRDYIFSLIKSFPEDPAFVLPERSAVTMTVPFMRAYTELLVRTCHRRGAHAIGVMAAFIPGHDPEANARALARVREDKRREAGDGFDGSRVAHPELVETCREEFDKVLGGRPNQLERLREDVSVEAADLLAVDRTPGVITAAGLRDDVAVALRYVDAWIGGSGAVVIFDQIEDAATAEVCRCQLWQWVHHGSRLDDGTVITRELVDSLLDAEHAALRVGRTAAEAERLEQASELVRCLVLGDRLRSFFTPHAYRRHLAEGSR
ncbi:MAG TPA: malate synthase A [Solirubrobacterales bacterium]|nr:malate synthase A [Solirubrobacterales bacterium]